MISGSAVLMRAVAVWPSPSQTPSAYGGSGTAWGVSWNGAATGTE